MNATQTALLQTVLDNPDDDTPRLIYADYLEEQGETARPEFIRVQIELHGLTWDKKWNCYRELFSPKELPRVNELQRRERELRENDRFPRWAWCGWDAPFQSASYSRGFIHSIECTQAGWMRGAGQAMRRQPIQSVRLLDKKPARVRDTGFLWLTGKWVVTDTPLPRESVIAMPLYKIMANHFGVSATRTEREAYERLSTVCTLYGQARRKRSRNASQQFD